MLSGFFTSGNNEERRKELNRLIEESSAEALATLGEIFIHSANKKLSRLAIEALLKLAAEGRIEAQETLCRLVTQYNQTFVRELVLEVGYAPRDPQERAVFYFLTEQWEQYETLDFEQTLLQAALPGLCSDVRRRLNEIARRAGRLDFVAALTGKRRLKRADDLSEAEWHTTLEILVKRQAWEEMWRLAHFAPAIWGFALFTKLKETDWTPHAESEREWLRQLLESVERCDAEPDELLKESVTCTAAIPHPDGLSSVAISPDGELLATGGFDATVYLRKIPDGKHVRDLKDHSKWVNCLTFSPDSRVLISGAFGWKQDRPLRVWEVPEGRLLYAGGEPSSEVMSLAIHPDGSLLAFAGRRGARSIKFIHLRDQKNPPERDGLSSDITALAFSPDGQHLFSGNADGIIRVWGAAGWKPRAGLEGHTKNVDCIAVSPDNRLLASGGQDSTIRLWRLPEGTPAAVLRGPAGRVKSLCFSPDGGMLATGSDDGAIRLWRMPEGKLRQTLGGHEAFVTGLAFSPDGDFLASSSADRVLRLWDVWKFHARRLLTQKARHNDVNFIRRVLTQHSCSPHERNWLEFMHTLLRWQQRFDIELAEHPHTIPLGEFDIEIG